MNVEVEIIKNKLSNYAIAVADLSDNTTRKIPAKKVKYVRLDFALAAVDAAVKTVNKTK